MNFTPFKQACILFLLLFFSLTVNCQQLTLDAGPEMYLTCIDEVQLEPRITNWRTMHDYVTGLKSIFFVDDMVGYATGGQWDMGTIIKTTDGGESWNILATPNDYYFLNKIYFINRDTGFVVGGNSINSLIMKTTDGGSNWVSSSPGNSTGLQSITFISKQVGFTVGTGEVLKTTDCGNTWTVAGTPAYSYNDIYFADNMHGFAVGDKSQMNDWGGIMIKTNDGGLTWNEVNLNFAFELNRVTSINNKVYVTSSEGTMLVSTDNFTSWTRESTGSLARLTGITFRDPDHGIIVGNQGAILTTKNGGLSWQKEYTNYTGDLYDVVYFRDSVGMAAGSVPGNLDHGALIYQKIIPSNLHYHWSPSTFLSNTEVPDPWLSPKQYTRYQLSVTDSHDVYLTDSLDIFTREPFIWAGNDTMIKPPATIQLHAMAEVGNWKAINKETSCLYCAIQFFSPDTGYIAGRGDAGSVIKTCDGGKTWQQILSSQKYSIYGMHFLNPQQGYVAGYMGKAMKTSNAGESWTTFQTNTTEGLNCIYFVDSLRGFIGGDNGIMLRTTNGGASWSSQTISSSDHISKIYFLDKNRGFAVGEFNGYAYIQTSDGGINWQKAGYSSTYNSMTDIFFLNDSVGFMIGSSFGPLIIMKTRDGGHTWDQRIFTRPNYSAANYTSVFFTDEYTGYIVNEDGEINQTWDGGITWHVFESIPIPLYSIFFSDKSTGYIAGTRRIYKFHAPSDIKYLWEPETGISDATSPHPFASPTELTTYNLKLFRDEGCMVTDDIQIRMADAGIVDKILPADSYQLFPNPAIDALNVRSLRTSQKPYDIRIYNASGQLCYQDIHVNMKLVTIKVDTILVPGLYAVIVSDEDGVYAYKTIVGI